MQSHHRKPSISNQLADSWTKNRTILFHIYIYILMCSIIDTKNVLIMINHVSVVSYLVLKNDSIFYFQFHHLFSLFWIIVVTERSLYTVKTIIYGDDYTERSINTQQRKNTSKMMLSEEFINGFWRMSTGWKGSLAKRMGV